jgi:hypothetical protein
MEEKQYYEREADKHNGMNPVEKEGDDDDDDDKRQVHVGDPYGSHMHPDMHMHPGIHPGLHQPAQHDPRHHAYAYPPHMYGQPPPHGYYDYGHHAQPPHHRSGRTQPAYQGYPPPQAHYDQRI